MRIALVGKRAKDKASVANYLVKQYNFKRMRLDDGIAKSVRDWYGYRLHKRVPWETRIAIYDALYKIDPDICVEYLLRRLQSTTRNVVTDDVRYDNEVIKLKEAGYIIIRVSPGERTRNHLMMTKNISPGSVKVQEYFGHSFEAYPVDYSFIHEDMDKMRRNVDRIIERLLQSQLGETQEGGSSIEKEISTPDEADS